MEAIILAGGKGTRLRSVVSDIPKPMAPIGGKPFLSYILKYLKRWGISHIILSVGYKYEAIKDYFGDNYDGINISYCIEEYPLGTGGAIKKALSMANEDNVFIINGDTYFDADMNDLFDYHIKKKSDLTIAIKPIEKCERYGSVLVEDGRITGFTEKEYREKAFINAGVYIIKKSLLDNFILDEKFSIEDDFFSRYYKELNFFAQIQDKYFIDIGIPEDYEQAQKELIKLYE